MYRCQGWGSPYGGLPPPLASELKTSKISKSVTCSRPSVRLQQSHKSHKSHKSNVCMYVFLAWLYYTSLGRHSTIATGYASGSLRGEIGAPPEGRLYPKALPEHIGRVRGGSRGLGAGQRLSSRLVQAASPPPPARRAFASPSAGATEVAPLVPLVAVVAVSPSATAYNTRGNL